MYEVFYKKNYLGSTDNPTILAGFLKSLSDLELSTTTVVINESDENEVKILGLEWLTSNPKIADQSLTVGDMVLNPENPGGSCCVINAILLPRGGHEGYFGLKPMMSYGWPSKDYNKGKVYKIENILKMKPVSSKGTYKHLKACPDCTPYKDKNDPYKLFIHPLRKKNIYVDEYQCQTCKKVFIIDEPVW